MEFVYEKFFILVDRENGVVAKLVCCQWILFTLLVVQCILFIVFMKILWGVKLPAAFIREIMKTVKRWK